ncbi:hypothetical protein BSKO_13372 [Bryopsis sp. KO-2023]|nr:hypothetical protein BSKO_13372 [Bryopsis sp. KO-2023]
MADSDGHRMNLARAGKWHFPVWMQCGECDYLGCAAFSLSSAWPWVAQGINRHVAFGSRGWLWSLLFLILLCPVVLLIIGSDSVRIHCYYVNKENFPQYKGDAPASLCITGHRFRPVAFTVCAVLMSLGLFIWTVHGILMRMRIRQEYNIQGHWIKDVLLWIWCQPCALAQETRTLMKYQLEEGARRQNSIGLPTYGKSQTEEQRRNGSVEDLPL